MATTPQPPNRPSTPPPPPAQPSRPPGASPSNPPSNPAPKPADPKAVSENTKPPDQGGGDVSAHPSPITDPTNAAPEPAQWSDDNPRPPLARPGTKDYVAGQPINQEEYETTEREAAERVRPEAWDRVKGQGVEVDDGMKDASSGWSDETTKAQEEADAKWNRDREGTRPDGRPLRDPRTADDDINKAPGGVGGQGTRADGRARAPEESSRR